MSTSSLCVYECTLICFLFFWFSIFSILLLSLSLTYIILLIWMYEWLWISMCEYFPLNWESWVGKIVLIKFGFLTKFIWWLCSSSSSSDRERQQRNISFALNSTNPVANKQLNTFDSRNGSDNWLRQHQGVFIFIRIASVLISINICVCVSVRLKLKLS